MARRFALRSVGVALAAAVMVLLGSTVASAAPAVPRFASVAQATITPGALMITPFDGNAASACTANFVFSGGGATYLGYAAHCAAAGDPTGHSGCDAETLPIGSTVVIEGSDESQTRGRLAYSSWITMQERGESGPQCDLNDFALVELDPAAVASANPSVPELGGPTGLDTDGTERGEPVFSYQPNNDDTAVKQGSSLGDTAGGLTHRVTTEPPGAPGDSGSGYLDGDGEAFGVLSTQFLDGSDANGVADLAMALSYANRYGGIGQVTLTPGTEPFTPPGPSADLAA